MASGQNTAVEVFEFNKDDPIQGTRLVKRPVPEPGEGQVLVNILLRPINPSDVMSLIGVYPGFTTKLPGVPGIDGMGVVAETGPGVDTAKFPKGQRVTALGWPAHEGNGSWQEYVAINQKQLVPVPDDLPDEIAAQFFVNPVTVVGLLDVADVPKGEHLLVSAASSTLGRMLISYAKSQGVRTIGIVRRQEHVPELKALGATEVINSSEENVSERVKAITNGEGAHSAVDAVSGDLTYELGESLHKGGQVYIYGAMEGLAFKGSVPAVLFKNVSYHGFWLGPWFMTKGEAGQKQVIDKVLQALRTGVMKPEAGKILPLEQYAEGVQETNKPGRKGKVLLTSRKR